MAQPNNFGLNGQFGTDGQFVLSNNGSGAYQQQRGQQNTPPQQQQQQQYPFQQLPHHQQQNWQLLQLQQQLQQIQQQQQQQQQQQVPFDAYGNGFPSNNVQHSGHPTNHIHGRLPTPGGNLQRLPVSNFHFQQRLYNPSMTNEFQDYHQHKHFSNATSTRNQNNNEDAFVVQPQSHQTKGYMPPQTYEQVQIPQPLVQMSPVPLSVPLAQGQSEAHVTHSPARTHPKIEDNEADDAIEDDVVILDERLIPMSDRSKMHIYSKLGTDYDEEKQEQFTTSKSNSLSPVSSSGDIIPVPLTKRGHGSPSLINKKRFTKVGSPALNISKKENIPQVVSPAPSIPKKESITEGAFKNEVNTQEPSRQLQNPTPARSADNSPSMPSITLVNQNLPQQQQLLLPLQKPHEHQLQQQGDKKRPSPAEIIASIRKKPKSAQVDQDVFNPGQNRFEQDMAKILKFFENKEDTLLFFVKLIKDNVEYFKNDFEQLSDRLCKLFLSIPESLYHQKPDYRYEGWSCLVELINDRSFWLLSSFTMKKFFLRVRTWLVHDMKTKDLQGIENSLSLLHKIKHPKSNLEAFKLWNLFVKINKMDRYPNLKQLATELMINDINVPLPNDKKPLAASAHSSSVMKSISAAASTKKADAKPVITRSSIFINDPYKNKRETEKLNDKSSSQQQLQEKQQEQKLQRKKWAVSDYFGKAKAAQQAQLQQIEQKEKQEKEEEERVRTEDGLISILRKKSPQLEPRKRRKAAARGVRFNDLELESVKIIESYDRRANAVGIHASNEGSAMMGVVDDEETEWSDPVPFVVSSLPWYNAEFYDGNPNFRGGDVEVASVDRLEQIQRNQVLKPTNYSLSRNIPPSPHESSSLNILPPKIEEARMIPFGTAGR